MMHASAISKKLNKLFEKKGFVHFVYESFRVRRSPNSFLKITVEQMFYQFGALVDFE